MSDTDEKPTAPKPEQAGEIKRREFLNKIAGGSLGIAAAGAGLVSLKYISPNVLFEPPSRFRVGPPENYPINSVTTITDQLTYLVRVPQGFYAETQICQHLGCITQWHPEANLIECPCHGSRYKMNGAIVRGPTTRPLPHYAIQLMPDGTLQIDKSKIVPRSLILKV